MKNTSKRIPIKFYTLVLLVSGNINTVNTRQLNLSFSLRMCCFRTSLHEGKLPKLMVDFVSILSSSHFSCKIDNVNSLASLFCFCEWSRSYKLFQFCFEISRYWERTIFVNNFYRLYLLRFFETTGSITLGEIMQSQKWTTSFYW